MLEKYFVRPQTIDRIRASWIASAIERYVTWLTEQGYRPRNVYRRVPILLRFGEFAASQGATTLEDLPAHGVPFVEAWVNGRARGRHRDEARKKVAGEARVPAEQMLRLTVPGFRGTGRPKAALPFRQTAPSFFAYLRDERGLREASVWHYAHHLRRFERYLERIGLNDFDGLTPALLSAFVVDSSQGLAKTGLRDRCGVLRVFLRYLHREQLIPRDLSPTIESPQVYRLATIPRSITWSDVRRVLEQVDRRSLVGKRDYAILLLLVTYGLRAREVAALSLDHIDWRVERLRVPERKADHSTAFPLSPIVGEALLEYIQQGRPESPFREVFLRVLAPHGPLTHGAISARAAHYLRRAEVDVPRPGSHTLRHTCVQRLVDTDFSLKEIGDFIGHRSPSSTEIYSKVAIESLRELALGDGEDVL